MNAKKKGNKGENDFANWLQINGIKAYRNSSSGGNTWKSDIHNGLGYNLEVKTVKRINLLDAWKQSERDANMAHTTPLLAVHFDGMPKDQWLIVIHSETWLDYVKNAPETKETEGGAIPLHTPLSYSEKSAISRARNALSEVAKVLDRFYE